MGSTAATAIALGSLALAALTVVVSFLNVRRQADAAMTLEHAKWVRDKRDDVYGRILALLDFENWNPLPKPDDGLWIELREVVDLTVRYASDAVLANTLILTNDLRDRLQLDPALPPPPKTAAILSARFFLIQQVREELAGRQEGCKTMRRYFRGDRGG